MTFAPSSPLALTHASVALQTPQREVYRAALPAGTNMAEIDYLSYAFAVVVLGGGIVGFVKAGEPTHELGTCTCADRVHPLY